MSPHSPGLRNPSPLPSGIYSSEKILRLNDPSAPTSPMCSDDTLHVPTEDGHDAMSDIGSVASNGVSSQSATYPFYAHRMYLERSPYFQTYFSDIQDGSPIIQVTIPANADSFYDILRHIYMQRVERRHLDSEALIGTFLNAEFLGLSALVTSCQQEFALNWESVIKSDDFTWRRITTSQLKTLMNTTMDVFHKEPHRKLKIILQWCRSWPKNRIHEVRQMISEEMKGGFADRLDLAELESLQVTFGAEFDNVIPPSVVMKVVQNFRNSTRNSYSSNHASGERSSNRESAYWKSKQRDSVGSNSGYSSGERTSSRNPRESSKRK
ncbi:hypothetical protein HK096_002557 [Nowakowskiella sp. JEL0078]|nr:hypothetical protein HK096_002557 [Nowakowskiella sp. JEL0078]